MTRLSCLLVLAFPAAGGSSSAGSGRIAFETNHFCGAMDCGRGEQIPALFDAGNLTVSEIADLLNITPGTVTRYLPETVRERRLHDVAVLRVRGLVPIAIADALKLSDRTVAGYLLKAGLERSSLGRSSLGAHLHAEALS